MTHDNDYAQLAALSQQREIERLRQENARLRRMLHDMTGLTDWMRAGYPESEYQAIVREFEGEE